MCHQSGAHFSLDIAPVLLLPEQDWRTIGVLPPPVPIRAARVWTVPSSLSFTRQSCGWFSIAKASGNTLSVRSPTYWLPESGMSPPPTRCPGPSRTDPLASPELPSTEEEGVFPSFLSALKFLRRPGRLNDISPADCPSRSRTRKILRRLWGTPQPLASRTLHAMENPSAMISPLLGHLILPPP